MCHIVSWIHLQCMFKVHLGHQRVLLLQQNFAEQDERYIHSRFEEHCPIQSLLRAVKVAGTDVSISQPFVHGAVKRIKVWFWFKAGEAVGQLPMGERDLAEKKVCPRKARIECERFTR